jgi:D-alanyl-D-alanine dipeptidase
VKTPFALIATAVLLGAAPQAKPGLPADFVYLSDVAPDVVQDIRYAGYHNFVGRPVRGYDAAQCILTREAAQAIAAVERELIDAGLTIIVYDCYRPKRAVDDFVAWSKNDDRRMKTEFYPQVAKSELFSLGYLAVKSAHSRGSTVDVSIERLPPRPVASYEPGEELYSCIAPFAQRFHDGSIDMGTAFDCLDPLSHFASDVGIVANAHRQLLRNVMHKHGFNGVAGEWWHYTLRWEPFPDRYFDFPIETKPTP